MTAIQRFGRTGTGTFDLIDNLTMNYKGNQLIKAEDAVSTSNFSNQGDFRNEVSKTVEYEYDKNGNMTKDFNKGIDSISYNSLNLPISLSIKNSLGSATNNYTYSANGKKLKVEMKFGNQTKTTDYVGNMIYEYGALKRILVDGGYVENGQYHFYIQDHLGNNRVVAKTDGTVIQTNHYYPFGMTFMEDGTHDAKAQPYKYNGKEFDGERGLNLYDYLARSVDAVEGRFTGVDPLCEKFYSISPYAYCINNPIRLIDVDGRIPTTAEAAAMAAHVYVDKTNRILIGGWQVSNRDFGIKMNTESGLQSQVYERTVAGKTEYTYATAGTQNWTDVKQDVAQPLGLSSQYSESVGNAKAINQELGKSNQELTFVGHSLGGGEAALNALVTNNKAITFNAAEVSNITKAKVGGLLLPLKSESKINAVIMLTDPLNAVQKNLGLPVANGIKTIIYPTDLKSVVNGHSIDNVLKNYSIDPNKYIKPLRQ